MNTTTINNDHNKIYKNITITLLINIIIIFVLFIISAPSNKFNEINNNECINITLSSINDNNFNDTILVYCKCVNIIKNLNLFRYSYNITGIFLFFIIVFFLKQFNSYTNFCFRGLENININLLINYLINFWIIIIVCIVTIFIILVYFNVINYNIFVTRRNTHYVNINNQYQNQNQNNNNDTDRLPLYQENNNTNLASPPSLSPPTYSSIYS